MSLSQHAMSGAARPARIFASAALPLYAAALFLSALLLFSVQPMFTKMVLPYLGGSPAVWSVAMVFFQGVLLLGYLYAHLVTRFLSLRAAACVHACVLALAFVAMPIAVAQGYGRPPADGAALWLMVLFAASVGLPFFAVSGNGPLLQAWFARSGHAQSADPYFLYGASNLGSFAALLSYPLLIEPWLTVAEQSQGWRTGFAGLAILIGLCAALVWRAPAPRARAALGRITQAQRLVWTALAFVPSALLVAVTAHLSTDVASAPFLWVVPLALFLLTFVLVFRDRAILPDALMLRLQPASVAMLVMVFMFTWRVHYALAIAIHVGAFFIATMVCHAALYRRRPESGHLTEFYVFMSLGGVLGGAFAALLAPRLFVTVAEYPLMMLAALLARPGFFSTPAKGWLREGGLALAVGVAAAVPGLLLGANIPLEQAQIYAIAISLLAALILLQSTRPVRLAALCAGALLLTHVYEPGMGPTTYARSFFGVHKTVDMAGGEARVLFHGTTIHGAERLRGADGAALPQGRPEQLTYYYKGGPFSEALEAVRARAGGTFSRVALVGMGVGALSCYSLPGEHWSFFEIDPVVVRIATDPAKFRTMDTCTKNADIHIGDARLTLADETEKFDLIMIDAFSSDVVPVHLITQEAFALYASKLSPHGAFVLNISNRNIELVSVVAGSAAANGLSTYIKRETREIDFRTSYQARAEIALVTRAPEDVSGLLTPASGWRQAQPGKGVRTWTDDYSNIVSAIWRKIGVQGDQSYAQ